MLQGYIKPFKDALEADRKENELLHKQVSTDRDMIDALNEKLKILEDTLKSVASARKPARASKTAAKNQADGTNGYAGVILSAISSKCCLVSFIWWAFKSTNLPLSTAAMSQISIGP